MDTSPIIAVASSAEDLDAVCELLSALPAEYNAALIIAQHLNSRSECLVAAALANITAFPVVYAHDGVVAEQGHVYLIPANTTPTITGRFIRLAPSVSKFQSPGDVLLASLAEEHGNCSVGVVLSGPGSDGALGIQAIKKGGGSTFAQYPGSARFPSMPLSAVDTGCVDFVLRPNDIARGLTRLPRRTAPPAGVAPGVLVIADFAERRAQPVPPCGHEVEMAQG